MAEILPDLRLVWLLREQPCVDFLCFFLVAQPHEYRGLEQVVAGVPDRRGTQFFSLLQRLWQSVVLKKQADEKIASQIEAGSKFECALDPGQRFRNVAAPPRSEERRVGKEGVSTCRSRWSP